MVANFGFKTTLIVLLTAAMALMGLVNSRQKGKHVTPDDGGGWIKTSRGVEAVIVESGGPADKAGIRKGDVLVAINGKPITRATEVSEELDQLGVWSRVQYALTRSGDSYATTLVIGPQPTNLRLKRFLEFVGLLYLLIGVFIFLRRWQAKGALHFYTICLASFGVFAFSYTGKLNTFDWSVYWLDAICLLFLPSLFLHFCLSFPHPKSFLERYAPLKVSLYLPAVLLLGTQVLFVFNLLLVQAPLRTRIFLDQLHMLHFAGLFVLGMLALAHTYWASADQILRQQMKWIVLGTVFGTLPFFLAYAVPYWMGVVPTVWMEITVLPLVLIPLTFGYAIIKFRLMDVDIIFKKGMASTLASLAGVGFYLGLIAIVGQVFHAAGAQFIYGVISVVVAGFVFSPLRNWIQSKVDQYFYRDRYDYRQTLIEFGKKLGSEVNVSRLLESVTEKISTTLSAERVAVFLGAEGRSQQFRLARSVGLPREPHGLDLGFLHPRNPSLAKGFLFYENLRGLMAERPEHREALEQLGLHYYLPCIAKGETIAYLGLGRTHRGDLLTSEDVELLHTIAGYVGIALENSRLYSSVHQKAEELRQLKEYSESIVESISVGVVVVDLEERIESWNPRMETLLGVPKDRVVGKGVSEALPENLVREMRMRLGPDPSGHSEVFRLYKCRLKIGQDLRVVDVTVTPLLDKDRGVTGRIIILDDKTERVHLEDQLVQSEKLTSIGLLAAGVAHEVNTPLAVISSYSQMLGKQLSGDDPKAKIMGKIVVQSKRASEIANRLLNFSRTQGTAFRELEVNDVISETLSLLEHQLKTAKIRLRTELGSTAVRVSGNSGKLQQVFLNLFVNAKDSMPHGGELLVRTSSPDSVFRIEVEDTGSGISEEHLKKIYDPFFTTKEMGRGTGLGLSVTYGIVQEHSGNIMVDSRLGQGTRFIVELPAARKVANV
jgi:two-component system NtrC family sensor kinase